jgi:diguanylate cyclase (GGDEF)-like protein/PAS domain S-box-containing protein
MNLPDDQSIQKKERINQLKQRAEAVLAKTNHEPELPLSNVDALQAVKLLEELRIYQMELELQNEELTAAQLDAQTARKRFEYLFTQLPIAAMVVDGKGAIDNCNDIAQTLLGPGKAFDRKDSRLLAKLSRDDRTRMHVALRDATPGRVEVLRGIELVQDEADRSSFDVHLVGLTIDYQLDQRILVLMVDRSAEAARREDQQFYSQLLNSSDAFIYAFDLHGKTLLANQSLLNFLGLRLDQVKGHPREDYLPLRDAIAHMEADKKVAQSGQTLTLEEQVHQSPHGGHLDYLTRKFALRDTAGKVFGVGGISTDITALKDQHRQALLSETVFQTSVDAIVVTDAETRILRVNPAFCRQTGFSAETVLGKKTSMLKSGRQGKAFYQAMWEALNRTGTWSGEINNRRADGAYYTLWSNINAVHDDDGTVLHYIAVQTDVTQLHETQVALARQAAYDSLTGLPNRTLFNDRMAQLTALSQRHNNSFCLLFIDLDRFKEVNDSLGHQVGDTLLREVAKRLQNGVRQEDTVARMGGDEFVVLLPGIDVAGARAVATKLLERVRQPLLLDQGTHYVPMASVGLAIYPHDGDTPDLLLRSADMAMYQAKVAGRNQVAEYVVAMSDATDRAFAIQTDLAQAIEQNQLRVHFQPLCRLSDGALVGAEALVRWERPGHGLIMPGEFIGVAEKAGLLVALDRWVLNHAVWQLGEWVKSGFWQPGWRLSVNQNVADLQQPDVVAMLLQVLNAHRVSAHALELEITEDGLMEPSQQQMDNLQQLLAAGVTLAIDDFGTGYSSLAYLRHLPVSVIKIDQHFVQGMLLQNSDAVLVQTIVDMAHNLNHVVVAEGIESYEQRDQLKAMGAELGQGYLFGRPANAQEFAARWFGNNR